MPAPWDESITQVKGWITHGSNAEYLASIPTNTNPSGTPGIGRANRLVAQLRAYLDKVNLTDAANTALPLYSPLNTPTFSNYGGVVLNGTSFTITNPNAGTVLYWTLDGSDPRLIGGAVSGSAQTGASPATFNLTVTSRIQSRAYDSATQTWSALESADFIVGTPAAGTSLLITEVNYHPRIGAPGTPTGGDTETYEFIELKNVGPVTIDLTNVRFTNGITYTFPTGRLLTAGERIVVVRDLAAFASRYPDAGYPGLSGKTVGPWSGGLDNGGETLTLVDTYNSTIASFAYGDNLPWPQGPDGVGPTLVFTTSAPITASKTDGNNWFSHGLNHGNPGGPDIAGYSSWAATNTASADGLGDADGDGVRDLTEYILGTNPNLPGAVLPTGTFAQITVANVAAKYLTLTYTRAADTGDVNVVCQTSSDLAIANNWLDNAVLVSRTYNANGTETYLYRHPTPANGIAKQFLRIKETKQ